MLKILAATCNANFLTDIFVLYWVEKKMLLKYCHFSRVGTRAKNNPELLPRAQEALEMLEKQEIYMSKFLYINTFDYYAANKNNYEN